MAEIDHSPDVRFWLNQIEASQNARKTYYEEGKEVFRRYAKGEETASSVSRDSAHRMNVLWSNVQTITPALYAKTPNPKVQRRYRDKDPVGKWGAIVIERSLGYSLDTYDVDYSIRLAVTDYLLPGCGQVWVSYEPQIEGEGTAEKIVWEKCNTDHLHWKDYLSSVSRTSDEDWWRARRVYLTKDEVEAAEKAGTFTKGISKKLTFTEEREDQRTQGGNENDRVKKVAIWEIWHKPAKKRLFVSSACPEMLSEPADPPHQFDGFFPCPRPLLATTTTESTIPKADFELYRDQANEIDRLTQRINLLTDALKVIGVYSAPLDGESSVFSTLLTGSENKMVPVANWAMFAQQGGFDGAVDFFPLKEVIETLNECYAAREQAKAVMYEITGISDIVRGASDATETATAQQIKSQWGSLRIRDRQAEVQRFVRDVMRLKSEIIAERYQLDTLKTMTNCPILTQQEKQQLQQRQQMIAQAQAFAQQNPEQAQAIAQANPQLMAQLQPLSLDEMQRLREPTWEEVYQLLRDQRLRSYRIDIETDSTINPDEQAEKQQRIEFVTATTSFIQAWGPIVMQMPKMAPLAGALLTFAARAFKQADALETEIEAMVDMMSQQALLPQPQQPADPKLEQQKQQSEHEAKMQDGQRQMDGEKQAFEREKMQYEREKHERELMAQQQSEQLAANKDIEVARVQQPRAPDPEEIGMALKPMAQIAEAYMQQLAQMIAEQNKQNAAVLQSALAQIAAVASAPRDIAIKRDKAGKIVGGTATPQVTVN